MKSSNLPVYDAVVKRDFGSATGTSAATHTLYVDLTNTIPLVPWTDHWYLNPTLQPLLDLRLTDLFVFAMLVLFAYYYNFSCFLAYSSHCLAFPWPCLPSELNIVGSS